VPLYEYECPHCGSFEVIQKFSDRPLKKCPKCGRKVEKLLSAPAIQFKGTGWYITDYARKPGGGSEKTSDSGESKTETKSEPKKDAPKKETGAKGKAKS
jgi:putative FmdB family regulatory protein